MSSAICSPAFPYHDRPRREMPSRTDRPNQIRLSLTRMGWVFLAVMLGMLWGSSNYNNNVGFIFVFLLAGTAGVSALLTRSNVRGVSFGLSQAQPVFAGQDAVFEFPVSADRDLRSVYVLTDRDTPRDDDPAYDIRAGHGTIVRLTAATRRRGWFTPGQVHVVTEYPLSLFRARTVHNSGLRCLVYPCPAEEYAEPVLTGRGGEDGETVGPGVDDFSDIRAYQPGDPMQRIAWKASTRGQGLFTKAFHGLAGGSTMLDYDALDEPDVEKRLSLLTAMVLHLDARGVDYGLRLPGKEIEPPSVSGENTGPTHRRRCLEALALFGLDGRSEGHIRESGRG